MAPKIKFTYFDMEGYGESTRLALILAGLPFEDERISYPYPNYSQEWLALKPKMPYGQVPVMTIDDGPMYCQSGALLRYVGSTLAPSSSTLYPKDRLLEIEQALGVIGDFDGVRMISVYMKAAPQKYGHASDGNQSPEGEAVMKTLNARLLNETLPKYAAFLTAMLAKNDHQWIASKDGPTIADCEAVPLLRSFTIGLYDHVPTNCLEAYPELVDYVKRFCALPQISGRYTYGLY